MVTVKNNGNENANGLLTLIINPSDSDGQTAASQAKRWRRSYAGFVEAGEGATAIGCDSESPRR